MLINIANVIPGIGPGVNPCDKYNEKYFCWSLSTTSCAPRNSYRIYVLCFGSLILYANIMDDLE